MILTAFGPFGDITDNPSQLLAKSLRPDSVILEVTLESVDEFLAGLDPTQFDQMLHLGVAANRNVLSLETVAKNWIGAHKDANLQLIGPGAIDPKLPNQLASTLWQSEEFADMDARIEFSTDAGDYLCNYILFRSLSRFPEKRIGFLHIPPFDAISLKDQVTLCHLILDRIS